MILINLAFSLPGADFSVTKATVLVHRNYFFSYTVNLWPGLFIRCYTSWNSQNLITHIFVYLFDYTILQKRFSYVKNHKKYTNRVIANRDFYSQ